MKKFVFWSALVVLLFSLISAEVYVNGERELGVYGDGSFHVAFLSSFNAADSDVAPYFRARVGYKAQLDEKWAFNVRVSSDYFRFDSSRTVNPVFDKAYLLYNLSENQKLLMGRIPTYPFDADLFVDTGNTTWHDIYVDGIALFTTLNDIDLSLLYAILDYNGTPNQDTAHNALMLVGEKKGDSLSFGGGVYAVFKTDNDPALNNDYVAVLVKVSYKTGGFDFSGAFLTSNGDDAFNRNGEDTWAFSIGVSTTFGENEISVNYADARKAALYPTNFLANDYVASTVTPDGNNLYYYNVNLTRPLGDDIKLVGDFTMAEYTSTPPGSDSGRYGFYVEIHYNF